MREYKYGIRIMKSGTVFSEGWLKEKSDWKNWMDNGYEKLTAVLFELHYDEATGFYSFGKEIEVLN